MKIIIIGAGIAGLTLGLACERAGIEYKIKEKTKILKNIGGGIIIWPSGVRYLEWLGIDTSLKQLQTEVVGCNVLNSEANLIFNEPFKELSEVLGGSPVPVDRSQYQQSLLALIPAHKIEFDQHIVAIQHEANKSIAIFADGHQEIADLIVGADGIHSHVRNTFNDTELEFTNHCWWGGIVEQKHAPAFATNSVSFMTGLGKIAVIWPLTNNRFMWYLPTKIHLDDFIGGEQIHQLCSNWNADIKQLLNAPQNSQNFDVPIYSLAPQENITNVRTVLIGDAAHAMGPILGLGASIAIEDVYLLMQHITSNSNVKVALQQYKAKRIDRYKRFYELENQSAATMINDSKELLKEFEDQLQHVNLLSMYQELIPLIDETACRKLAGLLEDSIAA